MATGMVVTQQELETVANWQREQEALYELWQRYAHDLLRFATRLTCNRADAEDIAQEVILRVLQRRSEWDGRADRFRPWLFAIARNVAIGWMRRRSATDADLGRALEKELRCLVRRASQFLEARLAASVDIIVDRFRADHPASGYRSGYRDWLSLHLDHPPKDLLQAAVWSVQVAGKCVPGQA